MRIFWFLFLVSSKCGLVTLPASTRDETAGPMLWSISRLGSLFWAGLELVNDIKRWKDKRDCKMAQ